MSVAEASVGVTTKGASFRGRGGANGLVRMFAQSYELTENEPHTERMNLT